MAELILTLRERELARFPISTLRTTIGRDPSCDVVIDNAGISRLHSTIEVVGDSFVLRDNGSQNGMTLNGEPCREARLVDGDTIGLNKFLLRFSNAELEIPSNLQREPEQAKAERPKDVQRTVHLGAAAAQALAERAKEQIARQRAERAARGDQSLAPEQRPAPVAPQQLEVVAEEPSSNVPILLSCLVMSIALAASVILFLG